MAAQPGFPALVNVFHKPAITTTTTASQSNMNTQYAENFIRSTIAPLISGTGSITPGCMAVKLSGIAAVAPGLNVCGYEGNAPLVTVAVEIWLYAVYALGAVLLLRGGRQWTLWLIIGLVAGVGARLVAEVIGQPGEEVQVGQVPPVPGRQHAQRDGKIFPGRVGHHLFGARHPRTDMLAHAGPVSIVTTPSHRRIFQVMRKQLQTMTYASPDGGVG